MIVLIWFVIFSSSFSKLKVLAKYKPYEFCDILKHAQSCFKNSLSIQDEWDCYGRYLFRNSTNLQKDLFLEHDCGGVGWGNSIRALYNSFGLAAVLNRRIIVTYKYFDRLWNPPYGLLHWDYGLVDKGFRSESDRWQTPSWDYEAFGREKNFEKWIDDLKRGKNTHTDKQIIKSGICGSDRRMILTEDCTINALSILHKCESVGFMSDQLLSVPFFHMVFSNPSNYLVEKLNTIRNRLQLPILPSGYESKPGQFGLYTPGYYILALHFRRVPLGFEPLSANLNKEEQLSQKLEWLSNFWYMSKKIAKEAKKIAHCRNETLLIYFATDDPKNLRSEAKRYLSHYGKVIYGLTSQEVGHISPQWTDRDMNEINQQAVELYEKGYRSKHMAGKSKIKITSSVNNNDDIPNDSFSSEDTAVEVEISPLGDSSSTGSSSSSGSGSMDINYKKDAAALINHYEQSSEATDTHGVMALVEWWILGNAQWLVSAGGTSYSDTSAGWGFSPSGHLERLDIVFGRDSMSTTFRRDWTISTAATADTATGCHEVYAADPVQGISCPNDNRHIGRS